MRHLAPGRSHFAWITLLLVARLLVAGLLVAGCASTGVPEGSKPLDAYDPLQGANVRGYAMASAIDRRLFRPIAVGYGRLLPQPVRTGVTHFFGNLRGVDSALNGFLQGKPRRGLTDLTRVLINTTLGLGGLFDPATRAGYAYQDEDFGQTLAVWGYSKTTYLYLPIIGPTTLRDLPAVALDFLWPRIVLGSNFNAGLIGLDVVSQREHALTLTDARDATALAPYVFTREAYYQRRRFQIYDGALPESERFDEFEDLDDFEDE